MKVDGLETNSLSPSQNQTPSLKFPVHIICHFLLQASWQLVWPTRCLVLTGTVRPEHKDWQLSISYKIRLLQIQRSFRKQVQRFLPLHLRALSHCFSINSVFFLFFSQKGGQLHLHNSIPTETKTTQYHHKLFAHQIQSYGSFCLMRQILISQNQ